MKIPSTVFLPRWAAITSAVLLVVAFVCALIHNSQPDYPVLPLPVSEFMGLFSDDQFNGEPTTAADETADSFILEGEMSEKEFAARENAKLEKPAIVNFIAPTKGRLSSKFGKRQHPVAGDEQFHGGIDLAAPMGSSVFAAAEGKVVFAGKRAGSGNAVFLRHYGGYRSYYLHLSKVLVKRGEWVVQGQLIGLVGSSGISTGPHLHFEIRKKGRQLDPLKLVKLR